jgi:hypothetical protein
MDEYQCIASYCSRATNSYAFLLEIDSLLACDQMKRYRPETKQGYRKKTKLIAPQKE